ncbi:Ankyrin repeat-containing domain superfamily [Fusarium oxysporum f. sp. vasinfectum]|nr:Ankyrin repeat-containing domain superfamily [Fusarium oxysporum f. sp. vasinfectum]
MVHADPHTGAIDGVKRPHFLHACAQLLDLPVVALLDVIGHRDGVDILDVVDALVEFAVGTFCSANVDHCGVIATTLGATCHLYHLQPRGDHAMLLQHRVDPNKRDMEGRNLVHWAATLDYVDAMELISEMPGVKVDQRDRYESGYEIEDHQVDTCYEDDLLEWIARRQKPSNEKHEELEKQYVPDQRALIIPPPSKEKSKNKITQNKGTKRTSEKKNLKI